MSKLSTESSSVVQPSARTAPLVVTAPSLAAGPESVLMPPPSAKGVASMHVENTSHSVAGRSDSQPLMSQISSRRKGPIVSVATARNTAQHAPHTPTHSQTTSHSINTTTSQPNTQQPPHITEDEDKLATPHTGASSGREVAAGGSAAASPVSKPPSSRGFDKNKRTRGGTKKSKPKEPATRYANAISTAHTCTAPRNNSVHSHARRDCSATARLTWLAGCNHTDHKSPHLPLFHFTTPARPR